MRRPFPRLALASLAAFPLLWGAITVAALPHARPGYPVLVISGLSSSASDLVVRAGGYEVGASHGPLGRIAHSQDPAFLPRLRAAGGLLLLDAERLSFFTCGADA